ncbi:MAG: MFS transporter [Pseudomonadales bacterium]
MTNTATAPATGRERFAWAMFDFANSGYTTVVLTTIFNAYFVSVIAGGAGMPSGSATFLWTIAMAAGNAIVLLSAPIIGAISDYRATKKWFLMAATILCIAGTVCLGFADAGDVGIVTTLVIVSFVMFASGEYLISAFLPEIVTEGRMGRLSGHAWALGYFGGVLTLALCLAYITWAQNQGYGPTHFVPVTLWITAAIFALAALPTFLWLKDRAVARPLPPGASYAGIGFTQVLETLRHAARFKDLFRFLTTLVVFQSGVSTVVVVAAIYAQEVLQFTSDKLVMMIMVVNLTAAFGAFGMGYIQDRFGSIKALALGLSLWIIAIFLILIAQTDLDVWISANLMGLGMGSCQAAGRALTGLFTPVQRTGEFFGLWGLAMRLAAIIGPMSYGLISLLSDGNHRMAILSTLTFFVLGLLLLTTINENRGKQAAAL